jgi:hypothetical protein
MHPVSAKHLTQRFRDRYVPLACWRLQAVVKVMNGDPGVSTLDVPPTERLSFTNAEARVDQGRKKRPPAFTEYSVIARSNPEQC